MTSVSDSPSTASGDALAAESLEPLLPDELRELLVRVREDLHRHPELSFEEHRTQERIADALLDNGVTDVQEIAGTGVAARIEGRSPSAPTVAIRGDLDALPIEERSGVEYVSEIAGRMHACGHDVHATWTLGAALLLHDRPASGDVIAIFQPGEETGRGAKAVLESGALDDVEAIFGGHVDRNYPLGEVVVPTSHAAASADFFDIELSGKGGHAARPHRARNPVLAGAEIATTITSIVSARIEPGAPSVLTVAYFEGGSSNNVIPDSARLGGTIRATSHETREELVELLRTATEGIAEIQQVDASVEISAGVPPLVNDREAVEWMRRAAGGLPPLKTRAELASPNMAGEDFSFYLERLPGCFFRAGAREIGGEAISTHSPRFRVPHAVMWAGAALLAETARAATDPEGESLVSRPGGDPGP